MHLVEFIDYVMFSYFENMKWNCKRLTHKAVPIPLLYDHLIVLRVFQIGSKLEMTRLDAT